MTSRLLWVAPNGISEGLRSVRSCSDGSVGAESRQRPDGFMDGFSAGPTEPPASPQEPTSSLYLLYYVVTRSICTDLKSKKYRPT